MSILCYHAIQPDWNSPLAIEPATFARQCAWLAKNRRVVALEEAVARIERTGGLPSGMSALTFDDGFGSVYDHAFPLLERYRLPATIFLVAKTLADSGHRVDWVDDQGSMELPTLSRDQVLEMQRAGITFGSHSYAHRDLTSLAEVECEQDLRASRQLLEDVLHRPVPFVAYPRGRHDARVRRAAEWAGFSHGFGLPNGPEPPDAYAIPRVGVWPGNGILTLRLKTSRLYLSLRMSRVGTVPRRILHRTRSAA